MLPIPANFNWKARVSPSLQIEASAKLTDVGALLGELVVGDAVGALLGELVVGDAVGTLLGELVVGDAVGALFSGPVSS